MAILACVAKVNRLVPEVVYALLIEKNNLLIARSDCQKQDVPSSILIARNYTTRYSTRIFLNALIAISTSTLYTYGLSQSHQ